VRTMATPRGRVRIGEAEVDPCTMEGAVRRILAHARAGGPPALVVTPNAYHAVLLREDPRFRAVCERAWLSVADGTSLVWASRLLGTPVPERVGGVDLFEEVCASAGPELGIFLLGGRPGAAEGAARVLRRRNPGLRIAGTHCPPYGFEADPAEAARAVEAVRAASPDILFVGLGAPRQEIWIHENALALGVPVSAGVGASFDFVSGMVPRAPRWIQRAGLEWLFRTCVEPRRLWRRYARTNPAFVAMVLRQLFAARPRPAGRP
jgi:N-acetylglucosaminyldiphosphoundecaprenol N-acetyl-beta-D-mannosaminyltransferase